jgi:drug/metabolite transporter (DMT)-like permease
VTGGALVLVLCAAVLHAGWNALAKRAHDSILFLWWATVAATLCMLPLGLRELAIGGLPAPAVPFVIGTIGLHGLYFYALGRAYGTGAYSLVYPVARGLGVALVPLAALVIFDERLSPLGVTGIALVVAGIAALHLLPAAGGRIGARATGHALVWPVITGLTIASYSLLDKAGVARLNPIAYMLLLEAGCALLGLPIVLARRPAARAELRGWRTIVAAGAMSTLAYTLVLFAFRLSKTGYVVAARELSIVLSAIIGSLLLHEGRLGPRLAGALIVLTGVIFIAFAR